MIGYCYSAVIWTLFCLPMSFASKKVDWCSLKCGREENTMCEYKQQTSIGGCTDIKMSTTPELRKQMLVLHNEHRNDLASGKVKNWPKASNMRLMTWDNNLEVLALRWVQQCVAGHDKCRRTPKFSNSGQNWGMAGVSGTEIFPSSNRTFKAWYDEIKLIATPVQMIDHFTGGDWGHFTQLVWAESYKLGCAEIHYKKSGFISTAIVCNYGPAGNVSPGKMYLRGESCSKCPAGTKCDPKSPFPSLCGTPDDFKKAHKADIQGPAPGDFGVSILLNPSLVALTLGILIDMVL